MIVEFKMVTTRTSNRITFEVVFLKLADNIVSFSFNYFDQLNPLVFIVFISHLSYFLSESRVLELFKMSMQEFFRIDAFPSSSLKTFGRVDKFFIVLPFRIINGYNL